MEDPIVDTFTVVLAIRLIDMQNMCDKLAANCGERKRDKMGRRFKRAAACFKDMLKEISDVSRQQELL